MGAWGKWAVSVPILRMESFILGAAYGLLMSRVAFGQVQRPASPTPGQALVALFYAAPALLGSAGDLPEVPGGTRIWLGDGLRLAARVVCAVRST